MKIVLKEQNGKAIIFWPSNNMPFVVGTLEKPAKVGEEISAWYWGHYFKTIDGALAYFNSGGKTDENV